MLLTTCKTLPTTCKMLLTTCKTLPATCKTLPATCKTLPATCKTLPPLLFGERGRGGKANARVPLQTYCPARYVPQNHQSL